MYQVLRPSHSTFETLRGVRLHLRHWGQPQAQQPPVLLLHGWMDVSASWQFVVDALRTPRLCIAPDWRGFGLSTAAHLDVAHAPPPYGLGDHYLFADYLGDLDALIERVNQRLGRALDAPVDLVGHSMGGNVAMLYAGVRPQRVRRLVNLEGFGLPATDPAQAPRHLARWLDELAALRRGDIVLKTYRGRHGVAQRLMKTNRRLPPERALWLAQHWARPTDPTQPDGEWVILGDVAHKVRGSQPYRLDEVLAIWAAIEAPVLAVQASDDSLAQWFPRGEHSLAEYHRRLQVVRHCRIAHVNDAGHMLHHDQPQRVAELIEQHLA
ncbi:MULTISPECIES: alpha/beta fold hydrolase [Tepidimonas]|uniref:Alpha-beta hydrolase superfamily lysophospholipase n=2 Tax=Tepidimonas TaxID=114248 RepID=A0A4R3LPA1_9BURK|nr:MULTISPECIES: alpha/beta hydrolase [Tepidimonas]TCS99826.1 alpha-beta hydrolase superfamily lysophospholipase [Tepidimonas ignava]TSE23211.1 Tropinesterase [Tepidimonas ignava]TSE27161.1 Tropinesterase [Tepidimonas aquatica]